MSLWTRLIAFKRKRRGLPPVIQTEHGPVTEWARAQAAQNMKADPAVRARIEALLIARCGGDVEKGLARAREHYPEAYT
jgi:hypothetical protein